MTAQALLTPSPVTLAADAPLEHGVNALLQHRITALPITDSSGCYLGCLTIRHVLGLLIPKAATLPATLHEGGLLPDLSYINESLPDVRERLQGLWGRPLGEFLDTTVPLVRTDTPITEVLWLLYHGNHCVLPVVDEQGKLLGLITSWHALTSAAERP